MESNRLTRVKISTGTEPISGRNGTEGLFSMQPRRQFDTGVDVGSHENAHERTSADAGRPGRLRGRCLAARGLAAAVLTAFAALLALPLQAEAQKTTFVSNTGQSTDQPMPPGQSVPTDGSFSFTLQAQQFSTGAPTRAAIRSRQFKSGQMISGRILRPRVSIYTTSHPTIRAPSLYVLTNPATLNDDALNSFRAPANATLEKDTDYFVVFEATGIRQ